MEPNNFKGQRWKWKFWLFFVSLVMFVVVGTLNQSVKADIVNGTQIVAVVVTVVV